ncbi:helix-turn-helix domain-containing protein [Faecalispora anaeroviscerum]|uniref:helix-turn-helix domain-containing protein n=1 Tax=Faecalispora anaeroviscerum TaxID=2991836 RepID=UPI0024BAC10C|nr:helix-turn-helix domain-containing protein [Faecalispora anaeroviscerum]
MYDSTTMLNKILLAIDQRGITAKECLIQSNVNTSFLSDWKNGKIKSPPFDKIYRISEFLNLSLDLLADDNVTDARKHNESTPENQQTLLEDFIKLDKREQQIVLGKISEMIYNKKMEENSEKLSPKVLWDLLADSDHKDTLVSKHED